MLTRGAHDERAGDIYTAAGANVGEMGDDMGVRSTIHFQFLLIILLLEMKVQMQC